MNGTTLQSSLDQNVITGAIAWLISFMTIGLTECGPAALGTFRFERSLATSEVEISMPGMDWVLAIYFSCSRCIRDPVPLRMLLWNNLLVVYLHALLRKLNSFFMQKGY